MNIILKVQVLLLSGLISMGSFAQDPEMSKLQVDQYMNAYDRAFDQNRSLMHENVEVGLLRGELNLSEVSHCRTFRVKKHAQVSSLNESESLYHQKLGALDGKWDGRLEGCKEGFQLMAQRIESYKNELKQQWVDGVSLGEKIAALEIRLFSTSPLKLEQKCLDARRVQGLTKMFLSKEVRPQQQLSEVQLDCQSQAQIVVQRYVHQKQRLLAESQKVKRKAHRGAASISE